MNTTCTTTFFDDLSTDYGYCSTLFCPSCGDLAYMCNKMCGLCDPPTQEPTPAPTTPPTPAPTALPTTPPSPAPTALPIPAPTALPIPAPTALPVPQPTTCVPAQVMYTTASYTVTEGEWSEYLCLWLDKRQ